MIPFSEKLSFLMHITETGNKELADALSVNPSMISLMRTGKRKLSKKPEQVKNMALFFAKRCAAPFQRQALSEMIGRVSIGSGMPTEVLAADIENWLTGEKDVAAAVLENIASAGTRGVTAQPYIPQAEPVRAADNQTLFFFGEDGRREAMFRAMREIKDMDEPGSILAMLDDNLEWLLSDYPAMLKIQADLMETVARGFNFCQIMPPLNYINRYVESLQFWLPIYATGQSKIYYYPRLRGNLFRHSFIVVPGRYVQYSACVSTGSTSDITMFSTDPRLVKSFEKQFEEIIALCRPALYAYNDINQTPKCFQRFFSCQGETIQGLNVLSVNSMPRELIEAIIQKTDDPFWKQIFQNLHYRIPYLEERFSQDTYIDMCRLATAEEVRKGNVPIAVPVATENGRLCYTPETYVIHLKNILRLMDRYENYYFLPSREKQPSDYNLFANESGPALIVGDKPPYKVLEISRPAMVTAFVEHLRRRADAAGYDGIHREKVRMELRALIQDLENSQ